MSCLFRTAWQVSILILPACAFLRHSAILSSPLEGMPRALLFTGACVLGKSEARGAGTHGVGTSPQLPVHCCWARKRGRPPQGLPCPDTLPPLWYWGGGTSLRMPPLAGLGGQPELPPPLGSPEPPASLARVPGVHPVQAGAPERLPGALRTPGGSLSDPQWSASSRGRQGLDQMGSKSLLPGKHCAFVRGKKWFRAFKFQRFVTVE